MKVRLLKFWSIPIPPLGIPFSLGKNMERAQYQPPWTDMSIIGISGGSGSGKTSLALEIVASLNLPWVIILSMVDSGPLSLLLKCLLMPLGLIL